MVQERGEPHLPISTRCLTYPLQLMGHANPALRPEHGWLARVALGQASSLHRLRWLLVALVRRLRRYYPPVRLPAFVHRWLTSSDFPPRPVVPFLTGKHGTSRFSREVFLSMLGVFDRARFSDFLPWRSLRCGLPLTGTASAPRTDRISRLNSPPAHAPVNASRPSLRATVHDSGSV
jgi:hypothetical protein